MSDANIHALNAHMLKNEKVETALSYFLKEIDERVQQIEDIYFELRVLAQDYEGYDFSDELKEEIKERAAL